MPTPKKPKPTKAVLAERERVLKILKVRHDAYAARYRSNATGYGLVMQELDIVRDMVRSTKR